MAIQSFGSTYTYTGVTADYTDITPEEILAVFQMISANETPVQGTFPAIKVDKTIHECLLDDIARPTTINAQTPEGAVTRQNAAARQRLQFQTGEYGWSVKTTDRARETSVYGMEDPHWVEITRNITRMAMQVDVDLMFSTYQAGALTTSVPSAGTAQRGAGLLDWAVLGGEARANSVSTWSCSGNTAIPVAYAGYWLDSTTTISESQLVSAIQGSWALGNDIGNTVIHTNADWKKTISGFNYYYSSSDTTIPVSRVAQEMNRKNLVMDFLKTEFGTVVIVMNRDFNDTLLTGRVYENTSDTTTSPDYTTITGTKFLIGFDPTYVDVAFCQHYRIEPLAKSDLTSTTALSCAAGMRVRNPKALYGFSHDQT